MVEHATLRIAVGDRCAWSKRGLGIEWNTDTWMFKSMLRADLLSLDPSSSLSTRAQKQARIDQLGHQASTSVCLILGSVQCYQSRLTRAVLLRQRCRGGLILIIYTDNMICSETEPDDRLALTMYTTQSSPAQHKASREILVCTQHQPTASVSTVQPRIAARLSSH